MTTLEQNTEMCLLMTFNANFGIRLRNDHKSHQGGYEDVKHLQDWLGKRRKGGKTQVRKIKNGIAIRSKSDLYEMAFIELIPSDIVEQITANRRIPFRKRVL